MTAARLSPAATLLRNSKLFALPPTVTLPPSRPTAEPVGYSDTATTPYPIKAAIETPGTSLRAGDWGLKRNLPLKSTTNTSTPSIRLRKDIDTEYHVTDFDSAADHVVTLNKWSNISPQVTNTPKWGATRSADRRTFSVFHPDLDNATSSASTRVLNHQNAIAAQRTPERLKKSLEQLRADEKAQAEAKGTHVRPPRAELPTPPRKIKRWRYDGPWLAGMSNLEFDTFLKEVIQKGKSKNDIALSEFDDFLLLRDQDARDARTEAARVAAVEERGTVSTANANMSESKSEPQELSKAQRLQKIKNESSPAGLQRRLQDIKKDLRGDRAAFATVIARFLDLPDGPARSSLMFSTTEGDWNYSSNTAATPHYKEVGPPRTHPSAGFSYVRSTQFARNDPRIGPAYISNVLPARLLKDANPGDTNSDNPQSIGVGGLVARQDRYGTRSVMGADQWKPVPGGPKMVVKLVETTVQQDGGIEVAVVRDKDYELDEDNVPYNRQDWQNDLRAQRRMPQAADRLQPLDQPAGGPRQYRKAEPLSGELDEDASDIMAALNASFKRGER